MSKDPRDFDTLRRYETTIERAWYRAIRELRTLQKERRRESPETEPEAGQSTGVFGSGDELPDYTIKPKVSEFGIGCVSQAALTPKKTVEKGAPFGTNKANPIVQPETVQINC